MPTQTNSFLYISLSTPPSLGTSFIYFENLQIPKLLYTINKMRTSRTTTIKTMSMGYILNKKSYPKYLKFSLPNPNIKLLNT
jgi:hypothetical protein